MKEDCPSALLVTLENQAWQLLSLLIIIHPKFPPSNHDIPLPLAIRKPINQASQSAMPESNFPRLGVSLTYI